PGDGSSAVEAPANTSTGSSIRTRDMAASRQHVDRNGRAGVEAIVVGEKAVAPVDEGGGEVQGVRRLEPVVRAEFGGAVADRGGQTEHGHAGVAKKCVELPE